MLYAHLSDKLELQKFRRMVGASLRRAVLTYTAMHGASLMLFEHTTWKCCVHTVHGGNSFECRKLRASVVCAQRYGKVQPKPPSRFMRWCVFLAMSTLNIPLFCSI